MKIKYTVSHISWWQKILLGISPIVIVYLSLWKVILQPGVLGHNWDHTVPAFSFYLRDILDNVFYVWNKQFLGSGNPFTYIHPIYYVQSLGAKWGLNGHYISKATFFLVLLFSIYAMSWAAQWVIHNIGLSYNPSSLQLKLTGLACGIIYALSPAVFGNFVGGSVMQFSTLPLLPLIVVLAIKVFLEKGKIVSFLILLLLINMTVSSTQNFVMVLVFCMVCFFCNLTIRNLFVLVALFFATLLVNLYGFVAVLNMSSGIKTIAEHLDLVQAAKGVYNTTPEFFKILNSAGYNNRDFFLRAYSWQTGYFIISFFLLIFIIFSNFLQKNSNIIEHNHKLKILFVGMWLFTMALAGCLKGPLWPILRPLYEHFIPMQLYRSTQRLLTPFNLFFSFVFALTLVRQKWMIDGKITPLILIIILLFIRATPFFSGDFRHDLLEQTHLGAVDNYKVPKEYGTALIRAYLDKRVGRALFLPASISPYYLPNIYQGEGQGGDPLVIYSPDPAISAFPHEPIYPFWDALVGKFYNLEAPHKTLSLLTDLFSAKYIYLRHDVSHHYNDINLKPYWENNKNSLSTVIHGTPGFRSLKQGKYVEQFEVEHFFPVIRPFTGNIVVHEKESELDVSFIEQFDLKHNVLFSYPDNTEHYNFNSYKSIGLENSPVVEFRKISPVRYLVRLHNVKSDFVLLMNESYHAGWKLFLKRLAPLSQDKIKNHNLNLLRKYKKLTGNDDFQPSLSQLSGMVIQGYVSSLGDGREKTRWILDVDKDGFDYRKTIEKYNIDFISKIYMNSIQNENLEIDDVDWENVLYMAPANSQKVDGIVKNKTINDYDLVEISDKYHLVANLFANSWIVKKNIFLALPVVDKNRSGYFYYNRDGGIEAEIILEFTPQHIMDKAIVISFLTVVVCLLGIILLGGAFRVCSREN